MSHFLLPPFVCFPTFVIVPSRVPFQWTNVVKCPLFTLNIDFLHAGSYSWCPFHNFCPCPSNIMSPPVSLTLLTLSLSLSFLQLLNAPLSAVHYALIPTLSTSRMGLSRLGLEQSAPECHR